MSFRVEDGSAPGPHEAAGAVQECISFNEVLREVAPATVNAYIDSSVLLRVVLGEPDRREEFDGLVFATHDEELGLGAKAVGFPVQGLTSKR